MCVWGVEHLGVRCGAAIATSSHALHINLKAFAVPSSSRGIWWKLKYEGCRPLYTIVFPFPIFKFLIPLFPLLCIYTLSSRGAEKLLLMLLLSDVFNKSGFQKGESIRQAGEDNFCIAELLSYICLSCGMELNNSQLSCPRAPCKTHSKPRSSSLPPFGLNGSLTPGTLSSPMHRVQEQCWGQDSWAAVRQETGWTG